MPSIRIDLLGCLLASCALVGCAAHDGTVGESANAANLSTLGQVCDVDEDCAGGLLCAATKACADPDFVPGELGVAVIRRNGMWTQPMDDATVTLMKKDPPIFDGEFHVDSWSNTGLTVTHVGNGVYKFIGASDGTYLADATQGSWSGQSDPIDYRIEGHTLVVEVH
jgi:hypothetical protein